MILTPPEILLVSVVSGMAVGLAVIRDPVWKAIFFSLPLVFTAATLSLGIPVEVTHVFGMMMIPAFLWGVRWLHIHARLPIVLADVLGVVCLCAAGALIVKIVPRNSVTFWIAVTALFAGSVILRRVVPHRSEPPYRTQLPLVFKIPLTVGIVLLLIALKSVLRGMMAAFPFVGVFAVYESRYSLWTLAQRSFTLTILISFMLAAMRLSQDRLGLCGALAVGWGVYLVGFFILNRDALRRRPVAHSADGSGSVTNADTRQE